MTPTFEQAVNQYTDWSLKAFKCSPVETLIKLTEEIKETIVASFDDHRSLKMEYADCMLCLVDSMRRAGITIEDLIPVMVEKTEINKQRKWERNEDGTYSHIRCQCGHSAKECIQCGPAFKPLP